MNCAILLAAGPSTRFGRDKLFALLNGRPVVEHALDFLNYSRHVDGIWIVANQSNLVFLQELSRRFKKVKGVVMGGKARFMSVKKALVRIAPCEYVIIHNAANPFASDENLHACIAALRHGYSGAAPARRITSTVKYLNRNQCETLAREKLVATETPQVVRYDNFLRAVQKNPRGNFTDDLSVLEAAGFRTRTVREDEKNFKITTTQDLILAQALLREDSPIQTVGFGEDSHRFEKKISSKDPLKNMVTLRNFQNSSEKAEPATKLYQMKIQRGAVKPLQPNFENCSSEHVFQRVPKSLILCGVTIPRYPALASDSDGDVVLHALANALASSIGMGSLGTYATKACRRGVRRSLDYVRFIMNKVRAKNLSVAHCAISIEAARPKIDPYVPHMKKVLSKLLNLAPSHIGITAHTGEGLSSFGQGRGIACRVFLSVK